MEEISTRRAHVAEDGSYLCCGCGRSRLLFGLSGVAWASPLSGTVTCNLFSGTGHFNRQIKLNGVASGANHSFHGNTVGVQRNVRLLRCDGGYRHGVGKLHPSRRRCEQVLELRGALSLGHPRRQCRHHSREGPLDHLPRTHVDAIARLLSRELRLPVVSERQPSESRSAVYGR